MARGPHFGARHWLALAGAGLILAGCAQSTHELLMRSRIALHDRAIAQTRETLAQLQADGAGPHQLRVFIANDVVNRALAVLDGFTLPLPDQPDIAVTLHSARIAQFGSLPAAIISGSATRGTLTANVELTVVLTRTDVPGEMRLGVVSFVPDISWQSSDVTKSRFVRDLLAVGLDRLAAQLPAIQLPIEQQLHLGAPAYSNSSRFQTSDHPSFLTMRVDIRSTEWSPRLGNIRYFFVRDGIYLFATVQ